MQPIKSFHQKVRTIELDQTPTKSYAFKANTCKTILTNGCALNKALLCQNCHIRYEKYKNKIEYKIRNTD